MKQLYPKTLREKAIHFWRQHAFDMDFLCATTIIYVLAILFLANMDEPYVAENLNLSFSLQQ